MVQKILISGLVSLSVAGNARAAGPVGSPVNITNVKGYAADSGPGAPSSGTLRVTLADGASVSVTGLSGSSFTLSGSTVIAQQGGTWFVNVPGVGVSKFQTDNYVSVTSSTILDVSTSPLRTFSLAVESQGGPATSWSVRLEGGLSTTTFTTLLEHTEVIGDGVTLFSGTSMQPVMFLRSRVASLALGAASAIRVTFLGVQ